MFHMEKKICFWIPQDSLLTLFSSYMYMCAVGQFCNNRRKHAVKHRHDGSAESETNTTLVYVCVLYKTLKTWHRYFCCRLFEHNATISIIYLGKPSSWHQTKKLFQANWLVFGKIFILIISSVNSFRSCEINEIFKLTFIMDICMGMKVNGCINLKLIDL